MRHDLLRLFDLYSKFEKSALHKRANVLEVPDISCSRSVESGNGTLLSKVVGRYHKLLDNNSLSIRMRSNDIISNDIFSKGPFQSLNDQLTYHSKLYMDSLNNKDLIYQMSYEVYDPLLGGANFTWSSPIVTLNATLDGWKYHSWKDLLSLKLFKPGIDVGNKWLEKVLWPAYKRALSNRYKAISDNLTNCLVKMTTLSSMDGGITTVHGSIFALVRVGFYTTVWYKFIPFNLDIPPDQLLAISWDYFLNESAIVTGYTKITLLETKDISDIVMSIRGYTPFPFDENTFNDMAMLQEVLPPDMLQDILPPGEPEIQIPMDNIDRKWRVGVSLGIVIAFSVAIGLYQN